MLNVEWCKKICLLGWREVSFGHKGLPFGHRGCHLVTNGCHLVTEGCYLQIYDTLMPGTDFCACRLTRGRVRPYTP